MKGTGGWLHVGAKVWIIPLSSCRRSRRIPRGPCTRSSTGLSAGPSGMRSGTGGRGTRTGGRQGQPHRHPHLWPRSRGSRQRRPLRPRRNRQPNHRCRRRRGSSWFSRDPLQSAEHPLLLAARATWRCSRQAPHRPLLLPMLPGLRVWAACSRAWGHCLRRPGRHQHPPRQVELRGSSAQPSLEV